MHRKTDSVWQALMQGFHDREAYGLLRVEQLYRRPRALRFAWRLGWEVANLFTRTPLRTKAKPYRAPSSTTTHPPN